MYTVIKNDELIFFFFCDCAAGQLGRFCKHICAVHLFGNTVDNLLNLSDNDRIEISTLAVRNNFVYTFLHKMDTDTMETEIETECMTLSYKENNNLDILNLYSDMQHFNMAIRDENETNINDDKALTDNETDIELELLTKYIDNIK